MVRSSVPARSSLRAARWNRGISVSIRQYAGSRRAADEPRRPRGPSAPAHSSPVSSSLTDSDISDSWVGTPSSWKSRSSTG